jgi:hypothetical protein
MNQKTITNKKSSLMLRFLYLAFLALVLQIPNANAQISYSANFNANSTGWSGNIIRTTATSACGSPSMRRNLFGGATAGNMVSPALVGNNLGQITVNYNYKCAIWSANTVGQNPWGNFNVQVGTTPFGPWTTVATVNNETQNGSCLARSHTFTPPAGANIYIKWDAFWTSGDYYINFDDVVITQGAPPSNCSGAPANGTAAINVPTGCPNTNFNLSATGLTLSGLGISYQWQSAAAVGGPYNNIPLATSTTLTTSTPTTAFYRIVTTCSFSGLTGTSSPISYTVAGALCGCGSYPAVFAGNGADEEITNVTVGSLNNSSTCATLAPGLGSILNRYSNYTGIAGPSEQQGNTVSFSLTQTTCGGNYGNGFQIYIDWDQNGTFDLSEQVYSQPAAATGNHTKTGSFLVPGTALVGTTRMRVVNVETGFPTVTNFANTAYTWGETEDYCFTVTAAPACVGTPNPGNTLSTLANVCPLTPFTLSFVTPQSGTGLTYQWQSAPTALGPWTNIGGATGPTYIVASQTATTFYRNNVICSGLPGPSNPVQVTQNPPTSCYCVPLTTFGCTDGDVIARVILNTLDNNSGTGCPSGLAGYSDYTGNLLLTTSLAAASTYGLTVFAGQYAEGYAAWIDYNDDGVFDNVTERVGNSAGQVAGSGIPLVLGSSATFPINLSCTPPAGLHRLRVRAMYATNGADVTPCTNNFYGEVEDYLITITAPPICPPAGALTATSAGLNVNLSWPQNCSAATNYDFEYGPVGFTLGTGTQLLNQPATIALGIGSYTLSGLPLGDYQVYFRANCGGGNFSSWSVTPTNFTVGYCPVTTTAGGYGLTGFSTTLGSTNINQASGYGVAPSGYTNYSATQIVTQFPSGTVNFTSNDGGQANVFHIWVDWNGDLDFNDAGEKVFTNHTYTSINTGTITVPPATVPGMKRMRLRCDFSTTYDQQPCGNMPSGETEDYGFNVLPAPTCFPPTALVANSIFPGTTADISWSAPVLGNAPVFYEYVVDLTAGDPVGAGTQVAGTSVLGVATTPNVLNYLHVRTDCDGLGTDYSIWSTFAFQAGYCISTATVSNVNFISNVSTQLAFANINNNSTNTAGGYQDFTASPNITAYPGSTFGFTAALNAPVPVGFNVWVDWNQNLSFAQAGENVLTSTPFQFTGVPFPYQNTITVPPGTPPGSYRMRVRVTNNPITMPVCGNIPQGETEDYTLIVIPIPNCTAAVYASAYATTSNLPLVCTGQSILLNIAPEPPVASNITYDLQFSANIGGPYVTQQTQATSDFIVSTPGNGYYRIRILCNGTPVAATWTPASVSISNPAITSTTGASQCGPGSLTLSATNTPPASTIKWYAGPVGGAPLASGPSFVTPFISTSTTYFAQAENVIPTTDIGANTGGTTVNNCTPFTSFWESSRSFYMVKKSELLAAGLQAGELTSLGFDVSSTGAFGQLDFKISIAHTSATDMNAGMTTPNAGFQDVYTSANEPAPALGWKVFSFGTPFTWNGNDNIIVAVCHNSVGCGTPPCYGTNSGIRVTQTPYNSVCGIYNDGTDLCGATVGGGTTAPNKLRPNLRFGGAISACNSPRVPVTAAILTNPQLTVPANGFFAPTILAFTPLLVTASSSTAGAIVTYPQSPGLYVDAATSALSPAGVDVDGVTLHAAPLSTTTYTVQATSTDGCIVSGTYTITVDASGIPNNVCGGAIVPVTNTLSYSVKNTLGAAPGVGFPCGPLANQVWLKAIVPASGEIHVVTKKNGASLTDITASNVALFYTASSGCNPLPNNVGCNTNGGAGDFSYISNDNMTPGDTCYIRVAGTTAAAVPNGKILIAVTGYLIWTGFLSDDINNAANWQDGDATALTVPTASRSILVPAGTIKPRLFANATVKGVNLQAATPFFVSLGIDLNGFTLNVKGNWNVGPVASASTTFNCNGTVVFNGTGATPQLITGRTTFGNLSTNNTAGGVQANAATGVSCVLSPLGGTFNANGNVVLKSTAANTAALVAPSAGTISGNVSVERKIGSTSGYHYLSAPVSGATVNNTTTGWRDDFTILSALDGQIFVPGGIYTQLATVWEYDETNPNPNPDYGWIGATGVADNITPLKGFACVVPANVTVDVAGPLNNNILSGYTITKQTNGVNVVGNPYASPISWNAFRGLPSNTSALSTSGYKAFITTGGYAGAYGTFNGSIGSPTSVTDKIASSQAFLVECLNPSATINALNTVRLTTPADVTSTFFSGYNSVPDMIRMEVQGNGSQNEMVVYFDASSVDAYNNNMDSRTIFAPTAGVPTIYSVVENNNIAINVMGQLNLDKVVPLGVKIQTAGTYSLVATDMTSFAPSVIAYLEDTQAGTITNLRTNPSYSVSLPVGEINNRFFLHFHPAVELNAINETCAGNDGKLMINYPTTNTVNIVIKDANGNVVNAQNNVSGLVTINNLVAGNYVAEMTFGVAPNTYTTSDFFTVAGGNAVYANLSASANTVDMASNTTVNFTATAQGATSFNWNFGDGTVVTNGPANMSHTFAQAGTYNVTFEASNGICNTVATTTVEVTNATGLTAIANSNLQVIGVGSRVTVRFGNNLEGTGNIEVINMLGEVVAHLDNVSMKGTREIEMSTIAAGQYMVKITNNNKLYTEKVYLSRQ